MHFRFRVTCTVLLTSSLCVLSPESLSAQETIPYIRKGPTGKAEQTADKFDLSKLKTVGYLTGYEPAPDDHGVVVNNPDLAYKGYNYYTSMHGPEMFLMDMEGKVLHSWSDGRGKEGSHFRRTYLFPNGDVLAIVEALFAEGHILTRLDKNSNVLWTYGPGPHHDLEVMEDGRIYVLTREYRRLPHFQKGRRVLEDFITILSPDGKLITSVSILEAFLNSPFSSVVDRLQEEDLLHTNTLEVLDGRLQGRLPAFRAGNVLVSPRHADAIAVVDMERKQVVWVQMGMWHWQHQPTVLDNGNILIFDNLGHKGSSKVIEFSPLTQEVFWSYEGDEENRFSSHALGAAQRLPNGNTLITESTAGRVFEVAPDKKIVWEFVNPHRTGDSGKSIAVISEMVRLGPDFKLDWIQ